MSEPKTIPGGLVIIFEGLDGVGKTTQLKRASESLKNSGWEVVETRNLGGSAIGEELRKVITSSVPRPVLTDIYIGAAVQEALGEEINRNRDKGQIILIDRGPMSLAAYNSGDENTAWHFAAQGIDKFKPDLIIYYILDLDKAELRLSSRGEAKNYFEDKPDAYRQQVKNNLDKGAKLYKAISISADNTIEEVHARTMEQINKLLTS